MTWQLVWRGDIMLSENMWDVVAVYNRDETGWTLRIVSAGVQGCKPMGEAVAKINMQEQECYWSMWRSQLVCTFIATFCWIRADVIPAFDWCPLSKITHISVPFCLVYSYSIVSFLILTCFYRMYLFLDLYGKIYCMAWWTRSQFYWMMRSDL